MLVLSLAACGSAPVSSKWPMDVWLRDMDITLDNNYSAMNLMATKEDYAGQVIVRQMKRTA